MPVNLNSIPAANTLNLRISLLNAGVIVATLQPGDADTLTVSFDQVMLINPGLPPQTRAQNPAGNVTVNPGFLASFENGAAGVDMNYVPVGGGAQNTVHFT